MPDAILALDNVSKRFGPAVTADNLSLAIDKGEFFTFLGPSGSGKSTILRMIAGLERPDAGRILIGGRDMTGVPPWERNLGMVFQHYAIFPHMTVSQNVGYGLALRKLSAAERSEKVAAMLRLVGLAGMEGKNATLLSGGEQQRVALARALVLQPALLLLDEPLSALDEKIRREMQTEIKHIHQKAGTTSLYVTHDQEEALTMSDRIAVLNRGQCVQCDAPERLYRRPRTRFVAAFFRGCNLLDAEFLRMDGGGAQLRLAGSNVAASLDGRENLPAPLRGSVGVGGAQGAATVGLAIRAEDVRLGSRAEACRTRLAARLNEIVYRGTNVDHMLTLADGQRLTATSTRRELSGDAGHVTVGFNPDDAIILDD